ncbi:MAG: helix-turn-helix domain-containing protein [Thiotrichales bacterium]
MARRALRCRRRSSRWVRAGGYALDAPLFAPCVLVFHEGQIPLPLHLDALDKLCEYFDCSLNELLEYIPNKSGKGFGQDT